MKTYLYRLHFTAPVHFGQTGIGLEEVREQLPSDSITSALVNAFAVLGSAEEAVAGLKADPPAFALSSLFPFGPDPAGAEELLYAVPRPMLPPLVADDEVLADLGKDLKRLRYLQPGDVLRWLGEAPLEEKDLKEIIERGQQLAKPWDEEAKKGWWADELRPRVALDRASQNSTIWMCGALHFAPGAGLYGLVRVDKKERLEVLEAAFRLSGELGLGGERTYGMGTFRFSGFEPVEKVWKLNGKSSSSGPFVLLSRYYPREAERLGLADVLHAWDFEETRGYVVTGRMATTLKRKRLRLMREGSVAKKALTGAFVDVTPEDVDALGLTHPVYRSGLGLWLSQGGFA